MSRVWMVNQSMEAVTGREPKQSQNSLIHTDELRNGQTDGDCRLPAPKAFPRDKIYIISLSDSALIVAPNCVIHLTALIEQRRQL